MARTPAAGTRERILSTAARLFYEHGVRAVGMNQIISEAGTGKNLLYTNFPTKNDLVAAYLESAAERRVAAAQRARGRADDDPGAQLLAIVDEVASMVRRPEFRGCAFRNYLAEFPDDHEAGTDPELPTPHDVARRFLAGSRTEIADLVEQLPDAGRPGENEELIEQLWLIVDGLYQQAAYRDRVDAKVDAGATAGADLARRLVSTRRAG